MEFLTEDQVSALRQAHRTIKDKKLADRIKAILSLNAGFSYTQIATILLLDEVTLRRYVQKFQEEGIDGILENRYSGGQSRLSLIQQEAIKGYFIEETPQTAKEAGAYIQKTYGVSYSAIGITKLLHRLGFVYKKPKVIPGKVNQSKQEAFLKQYKTTKAGLGEKDRIYFLDATHPQHNTKPFYGWILKGKKHDKYIKTNSGRERLNLNGALNFQEKTALLLEEKTINQEATLRLLEAIKNKQKSGKVYLILDNAKYHHAKIVRNWVLNHPRFNLMYLPAYSPNLNLIERLWRFFHQKVTNNRYFKTFKEFKQETLQFFENLKQYEKELATLLTDNFQTLPPQKLQT
jgi:transposase